MKWLAGWMVLGLAGGVWAGPVEFGLAELQRALQETKVPPGRVRVAAEVWPCLLYTSRCV